MQRILYLFFLYFLCQTTLPAQPSAGGNVWIVAVGIGAYQHDDIMTRLDFTIQGAYEFTRVFEGRQLVGFKPPVLTNRQARKTDILRTLEQTFVNNSQVKADDMILFYFSGHGEIAGGKTGICPYDYAGDVRGLITDEEIQSIMRRSSAKHKACFIEACKTEAQSAAIFDPSILENFNHRRRNIAEGLVYMTSTLAGKKSWGKPDVGGYFTHYLLRGLEGEANADDDAYITINELFSFVQTGVRSYSKGKQIPQINDRQGYDPAMPVMIIPEKLVSKDKEELSSEVEVSQKTYHIVQKGDTFHKIASMYGISLNELIVMNPQLENYRIVRGGDAINLDSTKQLEKIEYTVQKGDTFPKIAAKNKVTLNELKKMNPHIKDYRKLYAGDKINIWKAK